MFNYLVRTRLVALVAALPLALALQTQSHGQEPALEVFYSKLEPKEQYKYKRKGKEAVCTAGVFRWEVPASEFSTQGLGRTFTGYCAELLVPITADKLYRFQTNDIGAIENYNLAGVHGDETGNAAERRTKYILELFGRNFRDPVLKTVAADEAAAFQIALWEIIQESEPAEGALKLDLFAGDLQANYPKADAPAYVTKAQAYLTALTGTDDALFYENADLRGRELIRLKGIENADKVVAQSQFALRFKGGGAIGGGAFARALTADGGGIGVAPLAGGGGSGGGLGGGSGGGGFLTGGNPGNGNTLTTTPGGSTTTTNPPPPTTTNPPPTTPPVGQPETPEPPTNPPVGEPEIPTNPVPAPASLLLGVIALGTLGTWRYGARALKSR